MIIIYVILNYSHYVTCAFHEAMCSPLTEWIKNMHPLQSTMSDDEYHATLQQIWNEKDDKSICNISSFQNPCPQVVKLGILISERNIGVIEELNRLKSIHINKEMLIKWHSNQCSMYSQYFEFSACDSQSLIKAVDAHYFDYFDEHSSICDGDSFFYFSTIEIEKIPPKLFKTLIDYVYCHSLTLIQIKRQATIASFWDHQVEIIEHLRKRKGNQQIESLHLDPQIATRFVNTVDSNAELFRKLIKLYPKPIKHQVLEYEDFCGEYAKDYWNMLFTFIGETVGELNSSALQTSCSCRESISNWNAIKPLLNGTDSYFACRLLMMT